MINFKFPDVGEGIHEGQILKWNFDVGDEVEEGETLCIVETDKVNAEMPAPEDGVLKKKGAEVGETIHVGDILAVIDDGSSEEGEEAPEDTADEADEDDEEETPSKEEKKSDEGASVVGAIESSDEVLPASDEHKKDKASKSDDRKKALATPVARKLAKDLGVDINKIDGSGPSGRVMKEDIRKAAKGTGSKEEAPAKKTGAAEAKPAMPEFKKDGTRREKISRLRKSAVRAMDTSNRLIPATTMMDEIDVSELAKFRREQKSLAKAQDAKLTYLPLIIKAIVLTLKEYPVFNASFDHENEEVVYKDYYNIGVAVDTPDGLIVPNIKKADQLSIFDLSRDVERVAKAAQERTLQMSDLKDTTFSVTNYGAFGATLGTPVINHPEVAILGMGAIEKKPLVVDDDIEVREVFPISLTIDHRIIDGGDGGRFMVRLKEYLQNPMLLLLS